jgi:hypothetical protein
VDGRAAAARGAASACATMCGVEVQRIWWSITVGVFVVGAILLFVSDYTGYGVLSLAVAACAAINVR